VLEMDEADIKSSLMYWMTRHVLREVYSMDNDQPCYEIIENQQDSSESASHMVEQVLYVINVQSLPLITMNLFQETIRSMSIQRESSNVVAKLEPYIKGTSHDNLRPTHFIDFALTLQDY
jgi:hypothetical protein